MRTPRRLVRPALVLLLCLGAAAIAVGPLPSDTQRAAKPTVSEDNKASPAAAFESASGGVVRLEHFRGRSIVLNVWATWCGPCRDEMPALDRLQAQFGGANFQVVAVSVDRGGLEVVRPFFAELGIENLEIFLDRSSAVARAFSVTGIPTTMLIDGCGHEVQRWVGPKPWDSAEMIDEIRNRNAAHSGDARPCRSPPS